MSEPKKRAPRKKPALAIVAGSQDPVERPKPDLVFHHVPAREHVELEAQSGRPRDFPDGTAPVVKVHVRRGQDGAAAKRALVEAGAAHVVVAPVPSDAPADLPQREVVASDPAEALREYAKRHAPPPGTDLDALARELFTGA